MKLSTGAKRTIAHTSLLALAGGFDLTSRYVPEMQAELSRWNDGRRVGLGVIPDGPAVTLALEGGRMRCAGAGLVEPDVSLLFKNLDSALLIFTGQLGAAQAAAENRVCVHGDNALAMQVTRAMAIVQTYLFPEAMLRKTFKRVPELDGRALARKALVMSLLPAAIARAATARART